MMDVLRREIITPTRHTYIYIYYIRLYISERELVDAWPPLGMIARWRPRVQRARTAEEWNY